MPTPSEIVTRHLGGEIRILAAAPMPVGGGLSTHSWKSIWVAGIWSCSKHRLIAARGETRDQALAALDKKLLDIAKEIVG
jgi:hypothetical protein